MSASHRDNTTNARTALPGEAFPTASVDLLRRRGKLLGVVRDYFQSHGYWEVETPLLSRDTVIDVHLEPFTVTGDFGGVTGPATFYLQTSPEFCMKRLLAAGADRIYQLTRAFRQGERGRLHNPEFTMLEWYACGDDHFQQMTMVEGLCHALYQSAGLRESPAVPFERLRYAQAFEAALGANVLEMTTAELERLACARNLRGAAEFVAWQGSPGARDDLLNLLLVECVEPWLSSREAVFVYDYPVSQAALARINPDDPRVAERFELYLRGVEICNGYHELLDAAELRRRNREQNHERRGRGLPELPEESRLLTAMDQGLPACSGVAVGLDRLIMLALGRDQLEDVWAFPVEHA